MFNLIFKRNLEDHWSFNGASDTPALGIKAGANRLVWILHYLHENDSLDSSLPTIELQGVISK